MPIAKRPLANRKRVEGSGVVTLSTVTAERAVKLAGPVPTFSVTLTSTRYRLEKADPNINP